MLVVWIVFLQINIFEEWQCVHYTCMYSVRTAIPQICLFEGKLSKLQAYFFKRAMHKVKQWLVVDNQVASDLTEKFSVSKNDISLLPLTASSEIYPIDYTLQQMYKGTHACVPLYICCKV